MNDIPIIAVTGTKGKTTTVAVIADILQKLGKNILKVDTTGHFVNGNRRSTLEDSKKTWHLVPSVCPGRYLWEFHANPELKQEAVAVLECSLGCSGVSGLGYRYHYVGVFLNVFEDHLGSSIRIQSKQDIADAKEFIFSRLDLDGSWAVFNADDELVVQKYYDNKKIATKSVAIGMDFSHIDRNKFLKDGGTIIYMDNNKHVVIKTSDKQEAVADLKTIPWTFNGEFLPSVWNILSAVGAIYGYHGGKTPDNFRQAIESVRLDKFGGRLTLLKAQSGTTILADYAHEKVSIALVGKLAKKIVKNDGKVIGVVRLAHDRTDELMKETGRAVANEFDEFVVYEKIDGYWRQPSGGQNRRFPQIIGRTSEIFSSAIKEQNPRTSLIMREDEAIEYAAKNAGPNDVVVVIVNDDIERSIGFIKDKFNAEFV